MSSTLVVQQPSDDTRSDDESKSEEVDCRFGEEGLVGERRFRFGEEVGALGELVERGGLLVAVVVDLEEEDEVTDGVVHGEDELWRRRRSAKEREKNRRREGKTRKERRAHHRREESSHHSSKQVGDIA